MKPWTEDVVPGAGVALLASGVAIALHANAWGGVACVALGVVLLVALRALEYRAEAKDVASLKASVLVLEKALQAVTATADKAGKDAEAALAAARVNRPAARGLDY